MTGEGERRRWGTAAAVLVGVATGAAGGGWAGVTLLSPPPDVLASPGYALVEATQGSVGQTIRLNVSAQWATVSTVQGSASGVVTTRVLADGTAVLAGSVLYTVGLRPVVVGAGAIPSFRDLTIGMKGPDVVQLQDLLVATGHYTGRPDGTFGRSLDRAVRAWQKSLGIEQTGVVLRGDIIYVSSLPARLALTPEVGVGREVSGAHDAVHVLSDAPVFTLALAENQTLMVTPGMAVEVLAGDQTWSAVVTKVRPATEEAPATAELAAADGGPLCEESCDLVPVDSPTLMPALVRVVAETTGVVVPAAAVATAADGSTQVRLETGEVRPVTLVASASGSAVVEGVEAGTRVRTPGDVP